MAGNPILATEIATDPLGRGYSSMSEQAVADDLNTVYRTRIRASMTGDEVFQQTVNADFAGLTDAKRDLWVSFTSKDIIDPGAASNVEFVQFIFGGGSSSVSNLNAARVENISRAVELELGIVGEGDVWDVRFG